MKEMTFEIIIEALINLMKGDEKGHSVGRDGMSKEWEVRNQEMVEKLSFRTLSHKQVIHEENCHVMGLKYQANKCSTNARQRGAAQG